MKDYLLMSRNIQLAHIQLGPSKAIVGVPEIYNKTLLCKYFKAHMNTIYRYDNLIYVGCGNDVVF